MILLYTFSDSVVFCCLFFCNATATTDIYTYGHTLSLHDALPICPAEFVPGAVGTGIANRDIARAARRDAISDRDVVNALERRDHVEHRITLAGAEVPDAKRRVARADDVQRRHMALGQADDMDLIRQIGRPSVRARVCNDGEITV